MFFRVKGFFGMLVARLKNFSARRVAVYGVMLVLILSFAFWGVGDAVKGGLFNKTVIEVGNLKVSADDFAKELEENKKYLGKIDESDSRSMNYLKFATMEKIISSALLAEEFSGYGVNVNETVVMDVSMRNKEFQKDGKFSSEAFKSFLQRLKIDEMKYFDFVKVDSYNKFLRELFFLPVAKLGSLELILRSSGEERVGDFYSLPYGNFEKDVVVSDAEQKEYYSKNKKMFMAGESRDIIYIDFVQVVKMLRNVAVSEQDALAFYDQNYADATKNTVRSIYSLTFKTEEEARSAASKIGGKKDAMLDYARKTLGLTEERIKLSGIRERDMPEDLRGVILQLSEGQVSDAVASNGVWHIFALIDKKVEAPVPFEKVKDQLVKQVSDRMVCESASLETEKADIEVQKANVSVVDVAKKLGLEQFVKTAKLFSDGGDVVLLQSEAADLGIKALIKKEKKKTGTKTFSDPSSCGYALFSVSGVSNGGVQAFDVVKKDIERTLVQKAAKEKMLAFVKSFMVGLDSKFQSGQAQDIEKIAKSAGFTALGKKVIRRDAARYDKNLSLDLVKDFFKISLKGQLPYTGAHEVGDGSYVFATLKEVKPVGDEQIKKILASEEAKARLVATLNNQVFQETMVAFLKDLHKKHNVRIKDPALKEVYDKSYSAVNVK